MADVYEATYEPLQARVALKILKTEFALQERYRLRFRREAAILLNLDHPNVVDGREHGSQDGTDFYAMGFVDGISVLDLLDHDVEIGSSGGQLAIPRTSPDCAAKTMPAPDSA